MRGAILVDSRGVVQWMSTPVAGAAQDYVGRPCWHWAMGLEDIARIKESFLETMLYGESVLYNQAELGGKKTSWRTQYTRIDPSGPMIIGEWAPQITDPLSARELQVAKLMAQDYRSQEIAGQLAISVNTVETHRARILTKLEVRGVAGLTKWMFAAGHLESKLPKRT